MAVSLLQVSHQALTGSVYYSASVLYHNNDNESYPFKHKQPSISTHPHHEQRKTEECNDAIGHVNEYPTLHYFGIQSIIAYDLD